VVETLLWLAIYESGPIARGRLGELVRVTDDQLESALQSLQRDGRVQVTAEGSEPTYSCDRVLIPFGEPAGWEAALLDHHRAVVASMCAKLRDGQARAFPTDQLGGSTFSLDVWPGHPCEERALALLADLRSHVQALYDEVARHNASGKPGAFKRVTFYFGQMVADEFTDATVDEPPARRSSEGQDP
jgi:hypothetical protein